jgi:hippurate hydrolase
MKNHQVDNLVSPHLRDRLIALRHDLHRHPELSSKELRTADLLESELQSLNPTMLRRLGDTGVVVRVAGRKPSAPVVAVRGDIDALPIQEETGADFASVNPGVMHACGHDLHAAWTVGAAHLLTENPADGDVLVILQPAEETAEGARRVMDLGGLDGAAAIIGAHVDMRYDLGTVVADVGPMAASADEFVLQLRGAGAHAARPHEGRNPITGGAALVTALQAVVAHAIPAGTPAVITVATFNSGTASNIIPEVALLSGSVRAVNAADRKTLLSEIVRVGESVAKAFSLEISVDFVAGTPPLVNDEESVEWAREAVKRVLGQGALRPLAEPNLGGEDFAFYLEKLPGCFFRVGGRVPGRESIPAHSSRFLPADEAVNVGAAVLAEAARVASTRLAEGRP